MPRRRAGRGRRPGSRSPARTPGAPVVVLQQPGPLVFDAKRGQWLVAAPPPPYHSKPPPPPSPRSIAEWAKHQQRFYAPPSPPLYGAPPPVYTSTPPRSPPLYYGTPPRSPPLYYGAPPKNRYTTTYAQGPTKFRFKTTAANIPTTPSGGGAERADRWATPPGPRSVSPVLSPRNGGRVVSSPRYRIKPGAYDAIFPPRATASAESDDGSVEAAVVPTALLERFKALDAAEAAKRATPPQSPATPASPAGSRGAAASPASPGEAPASPRSAATLSSAPSSPSALDSGATTPSARPRPILWSGAADGAAGWTERGIPTPAGWAAPERGIPTPGGWAEPARRPGDPFFLVSKTAPAVVPTPTSSRTTFDLPASLGSLAEAL